MLEAVARVLESLQRIGISIKNHLFARELVQGGGTDTDLPLLREVARSHLAFRGFGPDDPTAERLGDHAQVLGGEKSRFGRPVLQCLPVETDGATVVASGRIVVGSLEEHSHDVRRNGPSMRGKVRARRRPVVSDPLGGRLRARTAYSEAKICARWLPRRAWNCPGCYREVVAARHR